MAERIGFDGVGQAVSGAIYLTGEPGKPYRAATAPIDFATSLSLAYGTLAAIIGKMRTGKGAHVQASLVGTSLNLTNQIFDGRGERIHPSRTHRKPQSYVGSIRCLSGQGWLVHHAGHRSEGFPALVQSCRS
ncbi:hypothetical protein HED55_22520 [Ochrobactrum haematophilum]|uniref:Uncharacterized protein n=1 Tax=Brucella haematophila TaxID=419474 RepID=A0ABX1DW06_9HYPH|nr:hypothetical protein [Brucella haematophila]